LVVFLKRLLHAVHPETDNVEVVLIAHMHMLAFHLSTVQCEGCRKGTWENMKKMFPDVIREAARISDAMLKGRAMAGKHLH
jgi:hypothetical protein